MYSGENVIDLKGKKWGLWDERVDEKGVVLDYIWNSLKQILDFTL